MELGKINQLEILRHTSVGLFLGDESEQEVLLPNKYIPQDFEIGGSIEVFIYLDHEERIVATTLKPKINLHDFALLKVVQCTAVGAFMDWGLEKDLLVPFKEQRNPMEEGRWYVVFLDIDEKSNRLYASSRIERFLEQEEVEVEEAQEVDLLVWKQTNMGYSVIVNKKYKGLIFDNLIFKELNVGDKLKGFVQNIRLDGKLDISLQPIGYENFNDANVALVYKALKENDGKIQITDKSSPEAIYQQFGISKKAFKKSLGALYKDRKITIEDNGIKLI